MGYFSNGSEGSAFEAKFCDKCVHREGPDGKSGCAVWLVHLIHSYSLCNAKGTPGKDILDTLIADDKEGWQKCMMFHEGPAKPAPGALDGKTQFDAPTKVMPAMREWAKDRGLIV